MNFILRKTYPLYFLQKTANICNLQFVTTVTYSFTMVTKVTTHFIQICNHLIHSGYKFAFLQKSVVTGYNAERFRVTTNKRLQFLF